MIPRLQPITVQVILPQGCGAGDAKAIERLERDIRESTPDDTEGGRAGLLWAQGVLQAVRFLAGAVRLDGHQHLTHHHLEAIYAMRREVSEMESVLCELDNALECLRFSPDEFTPVIMPPLPAWIKDDQPKGIAPEDEYDPFAQEVG